jgi:hypothetical protein
MTRLARDLSVDAPLDEATEACTAALQELGWPVEALSPQSIAAYALSAQCKPPPRVDVGLHEHGRATDVRIEGFVPDTGGDKCDALTTELNRVRAAIQSSLAAAPAGREAELAREEPEFSHLLAA